jgi:hypothetical protein
MSTYADLLASADTQGWFMVRNRPGAKACCLCKQPLAKNAQVYVAEERVSKMRGDDVVSFICEQCALKNGNESARLKSIRRGVQDKASRRCEACKEKFKTPEARAQHWRDKCGRISQ